MRPRADRRPRRADRAALLGLLLLAGCPRAPAPAIAPLPRPSEVWVDAEAALGGDGSPARPLRAVPSPLPRGARVHLATGVYEQAVVLPPGARLEGEGTVVLTRSDPGPVVDATDAALSGLSVQGGTVGVEAHGRVTLERVHFSGHRRAGLRVGPGAEATLTDGVFEGALAEAVGVEVTGGTLTVHGASFQAALQRAVDARDAQVTLERVRAEGPASLLRLLGGAARVVDSRAAGGVGPGLFVAHGRLTLERVEVLGHEYALQTGRGAEVTATGLTSRGAQQAGVALVGSKATLTGVTVERSGPAGGLQLLDSEVTARGVRVRDAKVAGVLVRKGTAHLADVSVEQVVADGPGGTGAGGDGLMLRDARVWLDESTVVDVDGSGVVATNLAELHAGELTLARTGYAALVVEREAKATVGRLHAGPSRGPAVVAAGGASVKLGELVVRGGVEVPVWAECAQGALVEVDQLTSTVPQPPAPCLVHPRPPPGPPPPGPRGG